MISSTRLGVAITDEVIRLALVSRSLNKIQIRDLLALSDWQQKSLPDLRKDVAAFFKRNRISEPSAVLSLPRRDTVMRQLTLPADAHANLSKVVEYQLVNLLPAEDAAVVYDYAALKPQRSAGNFSVTIFLALRSSLDKSLSTCEGLGIRVVRIVPAGVALANTAALLNEHFKTNSALFIQFCGQRHEVVGVSDQRLSAWREAEFGPGESLVDFLRAETDFFRSQARLADDALVDVFVAREPESSTGLETGSLKIRVHRLSRPQDLGLQIGGSVVNSKQLQDHLVSLAAGISGLKTKVPEPVNLIPPEMRVPKRDWQRVPAYALLAINGLLLLGLALRERVQESRYSARLGQEIARLEPEVKKVRNVEDRLAQLAKRAELLAGFKELNPEVLQALAELSQILPKHTVVSDLNLKEGAIQISGLSGEAAALPQIIDNSPQFRDVEFVAAITRSSLAPDKEGFRVSMKLESALKRRAVSAGQPASKAVGAAGLQKAPASTEKKP